MQEESEKEPLASLMQIHAVYWPGHIVSRHFSRSLLRRLSTLKMPLFACAVRCSVLLSMIYGKLTSFVMGKVHSLISKRFVRRMSYNRNTAANATYPVSEQKKLHKDGQWSVTSCRAGAFLFEYSELACCSGGTANHDHLQDLPQSPPQEVWMRDSDSSRRGRKVELRMEW